MAIRCPRCHRQYDITLFQYGRKVLCECGERIDPRKGHEDPIRRKREKDEP